MRITGQWESAERRKSGCWKANNTEACARPAIMTYCNLYQRERSRPTSPIETIGRPVLPCAIYYELS